MSALILQCIIIDVCWFPEQMCLVKCENPSVHTLFLVIYSIGQKALKDAGLSYTEVQQACVGYCYGMLVQCLLQT